nr:MAG TPA: terminase large subunit [Caudoviricetes sp.]
MEQIQARLPHPDGAEIYLGAFAKALRPDPPLWIDEWSEANMIIPADTGARLPGPYRLTTTPFARDPLRALSPESPCKRVVAKVASQLWKTQVGINWICASIARAPANFLALEPTITLTRRLAARIEKTFAAVPELRETVASPRSRDAKNTADTKEFKGGTLYINTAGSASNLAELTARYIYGDEIDRWLRNVGHEGDPIKIVENRATQYGRSAKFYYSSSPTEKDASKIDELFMLGNQQYCYVPCPHCGHMQILEMHNMRVSEDLSAAYMCCINPDCTQWIPEHAKPAMFDGYEWRAHAVGDGETESFTQSALYASLGTVSWLDLWKEKVAADIALAGGDDTLMRVFKNTRMGEVFDSRQQITSAAQLHQRAEPYALRSVPAAVLALTAAVDTQDDRLELKIKGWGEGMESWIIDYQVINGDPASQATWDALDAELMRPIMHPSGKQLGLRAVLIDSGGHYTQEVYQFTRLRRWRHVLAIAGARKPGKPVIAQRPSKVDVTWQGTTEEGGAELWMVGTDTAKDWITNRFKLTAGPGAIHFSKDLPLEYFEQLTAERKVIRFVKGFKRVEWQKPNGARNEAFDLEVYNLAAAHYIGMHKWRSVDWERLRLYFAQGDLLDAPVLPALPANDAEEDEAETEALPAAAVVPVAEATAVKPLPTATPVQQQQRRRTSQSSYLKRR